MANFRNRSVDVHQFSMVPKADIPRSRFRMQKMLKTSFDSGFLVPCYVDEMLPGDTFNVHMTAFARLATPIFPFMDNLHFESFFFFVPNRLVWDNWQKFMGEQVNPGDSTDYLIPQVSANDGNVALNAGTLWDYMGLPCGDQVGDGGTFSVSALPFRAYNLIYNEWFRDQNIQNSLAVPRDDGPDFGPNGLGGYFLLRRNKRHDYFTSCLPFLQKGDPVELPLGLTAPVIGAGAPTFQSTALTDLGGILATTLAVDNERLHSQNEIDVGSTNDPIRWLDPALTVDLAGATSATINQIRMSFQVQKLLERDARGGTRYTEMVRAHFGVVSPDARMQRPEYLGGGSTPISVNPVAQTASTDATSPQGNLAGFATMLGAKGHGFTYSATEHGYVIGLMNVRADLNYQQGIRRHWSRLTRYDFYFPVFAMLGEQAVLRREIYANGIELNDSQVFGYQERWAEYRYHPSEITGLMRSTAPLTIDVWHLAQRFIVAPTLNNDFIVENPPLARVLAVGSEANGQQLIMDAFFDIKAARPMPMYSVPGLIDHF